MSRILGLLILFFTILNSAVASQPNVFTCKEEKSTSIAWKGAGFLSKPGMKASVSDSEEPGMISLVVEQKKGTLKGNLGQTELVRINENFFLETTATGNVFLWSLVPGAKEIPTYLFQLKAYDFIGPFSVTVAYRCQ